MKRYGRNGDFTYMIIICVVRPGKYRNAIFYIITELTGMIVVILRVRESAPYGGGSGGVRKDGKRMVILRVRKSTPYGGKSGSGGK